MSDEILALAGGVGGAKLVWGLAQILNPGQLTIVVNTADDDVFHGLYVSPDHDTVMYTLADLVNPETGWGLKEDTFNLLEMLKNLGVDAWFNLGDRDLATHIRRTQLVNEGLTFSEVSEQLCLALGVKHSIVPMSDRAIRTIVETEEGSLGFQEYFVKRRCEPRVAQLHFEGAKDAQPSPRFADSLREARAIIFCPSNPFLSIAPILAIQGVRKRIESFSGPRIAVSPIIGGRAIKGPAAKLLNELGHDVSSLGVAREYVGLCDMFVIDEEDRELSAQIIESGMKPIVTQTLMKSPADKIALAERLVNLVFD